MQIVTENNIMKKDAKILIACEESGIVCKAFRDRGFTNVFSCDLLPTSGGHPEWHIRGDVLEQLNKGWDMMIAHPPCTHLAVSGARWFKNKKREQVKAVYFFMDLIEAKINKIAVENPISIMSTRYRSPDQIIQPWQFGHGETKATCLWLKNLPLLKPTKIVSGREQRIHKMPPGPNRSKERSKTFQGIADAMASQWS